MRATLKWLLVRGLVLAVCLQGIGCSSTKTASHDVASESQQLELQAGDEIRVITARRERFKLAITEVRTDGLAGKTLHWDASEVAPGQAFFLCYSDLAFIQIDKPSPLKTAGLVASVTVIGGLIAAIAAAPVPLVVP